jgi:hypothetical protein
MKSLIQTLIEKGYAKTEKEAMQIICEIRNAINQGSTLKDVLEDYGLNPKFASVIFG